MTYIVYKTMNEETNNFYIGITSYNDKKEIKNYLGNGIYSDDPYTYQYSKTPLQTDVKKWGVKKFKLVPLMEFDNEEDAIKYEQSLLTPSTVKMYNCYNTIHGGLVSQLQTSNIYAYSIKGQFIKMFKLDNIPADFKNICKTSIVRSCILGNSVSRHFYFSIYGYDSYDKARKVHIQNRPVFKYNKYKELIDSYVSQAIAEKVNKGINITKSIRLQTPDILGNYWKITNY